MENYPYDAQMNYRTLYIKIGFSDRWTKENIQTDPDEIMRQIETSDFWKKMSEDQRNQFWYRWCVAILIKRDNEKKMDDWCKGKLIEKSDRWFVTIGFNHQEWTVSKCVQFVHDLLKLNWIVKCRVIFELHRENGLHPHIHILMETKEKKGKILQLLWKSKGIKKIVLSKEFIDVKPAQGYHDQYINFQKKEDKMVFVEQDNKWRQANNIPSYWEK